MFKFLKTLIDPTNTQTSSKRFIAVSSFLLCALVVVSFVILSFKVALLTDANNVNAIQALKLMIYILIVILIFILVLCQIVTWQNLNETAQILRGASGTIAGALANGKSLNIKEQSNTTIKQGEANEQ